MASDIEIGRLLEILQLALWEITPIRAQVNLKHLVEDRAKARAMFLFAISQTSTEAKRRAAESDPRFEELRRRTETLIYKSEAYLSQGLPILRRLQVDHPSLKWHVLVQSAPEQVLVRSLVCAPRASQNGGQSLFTQDDRRFLKKLQIAAD